MVRHALRVLICSVFAFLLVASLALAEDHPPKVTILPLAVHGQPDAAKTRMSLEEVLIQLCGAEGMQASSFQDVSKFVKPRE